MRPVCSIARLGMQTAGTVPPAMCARTNAVPRSTSRSSVGVLIAAQPRAWIVSNLWSSVITSRMLGGRSAMGSLPPQEQLPSARPRSTK